MISEVLIDDNGTKLVRVLLKFNILLSKYPNFGTWCYLIDAKDSVVVFDTGPNYYAPLPFLRLRRFLKKTENLKLILYALDRYYPGKTIKEIFLSHYHFDHSEVAPQLQMKIKERFGNVPPIRLHQNDLGKKKFMRLLDEDITQVFLMSGNATWKLGKPAKDLEPIKGTSFYVKHMPGHTTGTIGLVSDRYKVMICGWWMVKDQSPIVKAVTRLINEDNTTLSETRKYIESKNYRLYHYHPIVS